MTNDTGILVTMHDEELSRMPQLSTLNKPFSLEELETCVSEALDGSL